MKRCLLAIFLILTLAVPGWATSYYVDTASSGGDGTTTATSGASAAFATVAAMQAKGGGYAADDIVSFNRGCVWRELLTVPSAGSSGHPIIFKDYGSGNKPQLNGANLVTTWADNSNAGTYDYQWDMESNANTPWDFTSVTDTGSKITRSNTNPHAGTYALRLAATGGTTQATVNKTGLSYASSVYASFYIFLSSDIAYNGGHIFEARLASEWFAGVFLENNNQLFLARNKGSYAKVGSNYTITTNAWHYVEFIATGIGGVSGAIEMKIDGTSRASASSLDWSAGYTITNAMWGTIGAWSAGGTVGTIDFDDAYIDADNALSGALANNWKATVTTEPKQVHFNGTRGTQVASVATCNADKKWYWASNVLYTYGTENPNTTYPSQIESGARNSCIVLNGTDYVTVDSLDLRNSDQININSYSDADNVTVQNCTISKSFQIGASHSSGDYYSALNNSVSGCGSLGINVAGDGIVNNVTISGNTVSGGGWNALVDGYNTYNAAIKVWGGANYGGAGASNTALIENNTVSGQLDQFGDYSGSGIWVDQWGTGAVVRYNYVHDNVAYGIVVENMDASQVYYNIVKANGNGIFVARDAASNLLYNNVSYGNTGFGIRIGGVGIQTAMNNNLVKNNISVGNGGVQLSAVLGGANTGGGSGNVYLNNCLGVPSASHFVEWVASTYKDSVAAFDTAYGSASATVGADPLVVNTSTPDFRLKPNSPCINAGVAVGLTRDYEGKAVPQGGKPDIGTYEWNSSGAWLGY